MPADILSYSENLIRRGDFTAVKSLMGVSRRMLHLLGQVESPSVSHHARLEYLIRTMAIEIEKTGDIHGYRADPMGIRRVIDNKLAVNNKLGAGELLRTDPNIVGLAEVTLDASQNFSQPLTVERIVGWHRTLFKAGHSGLREIRVGAWRAFDLPTFGVDALLFDGRGLERPLIRVVPSSDIGGRMKDFCAWFEEQEEKGADLVLTSFLAHLFFTEIHPFEDGNGLIARTILDLGLARAAWSPMKFFSMSDQIMIEWGDYRCAIEKAGGRGASLTEWLVWSIGCFGRALDAGEKRFAKLMEKFQFWSVHVSSSLNDRQRRAVQRLLDGLDEKVSTTAYAERFEVSHDTANRDIQDLVGRGLLARDDGRGRSTSFSLVLPARRADWRVRSEVGD